MMSLSTTGLRVVLLVALMAGPSTAGPVCTSVSGQQSSLMRCRGGLSMGGQATAIAADTDMPLFFHAGNSEGKRDGHWLEPGSCTWAERGLGAREPRVVIFPLNGPLAADPNPIAHQARACALDNSCTMEFCAYDAGDELRAVEGYIRLMFGGLAREKF